MVEESETDYAKKTKEYYDKRFGNGLYKAGPDDLERVFQIEKRIKRLKNNQSIKILDAGCGSGWLSSRLSVYGEVTGIDISEKSIEEAKVNYPGIRFICMDAREDFQLDEKFDIIVSSEVIEHVIEQEKYFNNIASMLKTHGTLILTTPNGKWKKPYFTGYRQEWAQPFELWLKPKELKKLAQPHFIQFELQSFRPQWFFRYHANIFFIMGERVIVKALNLFGVYEYAIAWLNKRNFGIYLIIELKN